MHMKNIKKVTFLKYFIWLLSLYTNGLLSTSSALSSIQHIIATALANRPSIAALEYLTKSNRKNELFALSGYFPQVTVSTGPFAANITAFDHNLSAIQINQLLISF